VIRCDGLVVFANRGLKKNHEGLLVTFALVYLYQRRKRLTRLLGPQGA